MGVIIAGVIPCAMCCGWWAAAAGRCVPALRRPPAELTIAFWDRAQTWRAVLFMIIAVCRAQRREFLIWHEINWPGATGRNADIAGHSTYPHAASARCSGHQRAVKCTLDEYPDGGSCRPCRWCSTLGRALADWRLNCARRAGMAVIVAVLDRWPFRFACEEVSRWGSCRRAVVTSAICA